MALYSCMCSCPKISRNAFYLQLFTFLVIILQLTCFIRTTWKRKQTMEQQPHRVCVRTKLKQKQNQVTSHSNWPRVLLFDLVHKQCNGIINRWLHCLTSELKGRFLVNNVLMFGSAWCLVVAQIQFSWIKKIKVGLPDHSLTPHPLRPITSYFCITLFPTSLKVDVVCVSPHFSRGYILIVKNCYKVEYSVYYFQVKTKILGDFRICINMWLFADIKDNA